MRIVNMRKVKMTGWRDERLPAKNRKTNWNQNKHVVQRKINTVRKLPPDHTWSRNHKTQDEIYGSSAWMHQSNVKAIYLNEWFPWTISRTYLRKSFIGELWSCSCSTFSPSRIFPGVRNAVETALFSFCPEDLSDCVENLMDTSLRTLRPIFSHSFFGTSLVLISYSSA